MGGKQLVVEGIPAYRIHRNFCPNARCFQARFEKTGESEAQGSRGR